MNKMLNKNSMDIDCVLTNDDQVTINQKRKNFLAENIENLKQPKKIRGQNYLHVY